MSDTVIEVENLSKLYHIGEVQEKYMTLRDTIATALVKPIHFFRGFRSAHQSGETLWALKDVSFNIRRGEIVGIVGRNGAGKSTLLKILSRITEPTQGRVVIHGRVGSLLEVGTGFHPELTGRENVYLNGAILGMKRKEIDQKFDQIVAFSEVEKFINTPVKHFSSGMYLRLAFAVAAFLEPEILLVDEILAVGDAAFQKKCLGRMEEVSREGRTVLFVSHNMQAIRSLCAKGILLNQGEISMEGTASKVIDYYMTQHFGLPKTRETFPLDPGLRIQFLAVDLVPEVSEAGQEIHLLRCKYLVRKELENVLLCVDVRNTADVSVFYSNDDFLMDGRKRKTGVHTITLAIPSYLFSPGEYYVAFGFWEPGHPPEHFPQVRLTFRPRELKTRLSAHGISWPSVIYLPSTWHYVEREDHSLGGGEI